MRQADPSIKILVPGGTNFGRYSLVADPNWNERVLRELAPDIDYLAVHNAYAPMVNDERASAFIDVYRAMLAFPQLIEENLRSIDEQIHRLTGRHANRIRIAITEWGPLFAMTPASPYLDHVKTLGSGLFVASALQAFLRSPRVELATAFKFTEYGFMGWVNGDGEPKPAYYALQMMRQRLGSRVVETRTEGPTFDVRAIGGVTAIQGVPVLDVIAGLSSDGAQLSLIVVNKDLDSPLTADIEVVGFRPDSRALVTLLTAPSLDANNGPDVPRGAYGGLARQATAPENAMFESGKPGTVTPHEREWEGSGERFSYAFAPRSVTALQMRRRH
jgi:alpha-N-arabinofuranosidase